MNQGVEHELVEIERRESHLWLTALLLLLVFALATGVVFYFGVVDDAVLGVERRVVVTSLLALFGLSVVFCAWVAVSRRSFSRIRRMFEAQAMRDSLTGLLNRQSFSEQARQQMARTDREEGLLGLVMCDLDDFKKINDTRGHPVGDEVLCRVAQAVLSATRGSDLVFRWGGDEIMALLAPTARAGALAAAQRIRSEVAALEADFGFKIDMSIGVALYPEHGRDIDELIKLADKALYIAKRGGDKIHVGDEELPLDEQAVRLVFQPVVDSRSGELLGHEVLSRDPSGSRGIGELFRRYEAVGQLADLKRLIFQHQVAEASRLGLRRVFVNVDFDLLRSLEPFDPPQGLDVVLDISEAEAGLGIARYVDVIDAWRERGYRFAIDDFGAGFISLQFVAQLFPSFIKMDRSALIEAKGSERYSAFLRDMLGAMRNYSEEGIIAEGVETDEELAIVRSLGVDQVQGHLIGRPMELEGPGLERPAPAGAERGKD
jgi:diguanylate cyclase (GGDEF)-like protein